MNPGQTIYLTAERTQWNRWTSKHRLKFRKRWRRQHHGQKFRWLVSVFHYLPFQCDESFEKVILHVREQAKE